MEYLIIPDVTANILINMATMIQMVHGKVTIHHTENGSALRKMGLMIAGGELTIFQVLLSRLKAIKNIFMTMRTV